MVLGRTGVLVQRWLTMRCTITPRTAGSIDANRHPVVTYGTPVTGIACRLSEVDERLIVSAQQAGTIGYDKKLLVPAATVVNPFDQVSAVEKPDPSNPAAFVAHETGPFIVRRVLDRQDMVTQFKTVYLSRVGGPG